MDGVCCFWMKHFKKGNNKTLKATLLEGEQQGVSVTKSSFRARWKVLTTE